MLVGGCLRHVVLALLVLVLLLLANHRCATAPFPHSSYEYFDDEEEDLLGGGYGEGGSRAQRSAAAAASNMLGGSSRKIQLVINRFWHLQLLPDGTVNGTDTDIDNDFTILQRSSLSLTQITIQGVATCKYLCMDSCGLLYGSKEYTDECVFNEVIEAHNFNTYSSAKYSNEKRSMYLALNKKGLPRKVQSRPRMLGKLAVFANVLTKPVPKARVDALARSLHVRHHHHMCKSAPILRTNKLNYGKCHHHHQKKTRKLKLKKCEDEGKCTEDMIRKKRKSRVDNNEHLRKRLFKKCKDCSKKRGTDLATTILYVEEEDDILTESPTSSAVPTSN